MDLCCSRKPHLLMYRDRSCRRKPSYCNSSLNSKLSLTSSSNGSWPPQPGIPNSSNNSSCCCSSSSRIFGASQATRALQPAPRSSALWLALLRPSLHLPPTSAARSLVARRVPVAQACDPRSKGLQGSAVLRHLLELPPMQLLRVIWLPRWHRRCPSQLRLHQPLQQPPRLLPASLLPLLSPLLLPLVLPRRWRVGRCRLCPLCRRLLQALTKESTRTTLFHLSFLCGELQDLRRLLRVSRAASISVTSCWIFLVGPYLYRYGGCIIRLRSHGYLLGPGRMAASCAVARTYRYYSLPLAVSVGRIMPVIADNTPGTTLVELLLAP